MPGLDLEDEMTQYTDQAHRSVGRLLRMLPVKSFEEVLLGPELRVRVTRGLEMPYVVSFMGQSVSHGKTGTKPERFAWLRDVVPEPVMWVTLQGDGGYACWLIEGYEPTMKFIDTGSGMKRMGFSCGGMRAIALTERAAADTSVAYQRTMWRWPLRPPEPIPVDGRLL
jgi:hypothetical protein